MAEEDAAEKSHEPTQKKLDDARKKGEIVKSVELLTAAGYLGFVLALAVFGAASVAGMGTAFMALIEQSHLLADVFFETASAGSLPFLSEVALASATWFVIPAGMVLLAALAQRSVVATPDNLMPKLSRISPIANAKKKFGLSGLFEFAKSSVKLLIYSVILFIFLLQNFDQMIAVVMVGYGQALLLIAELCLQFLLVVLVIATVIGAIDYVFQYAEHMRKNRMSHKEIKDETKETEGNPYVKQERRQRAQDVALNQMMADVPTADVIITNPTHYAVALKWSRTPGSAPECVAKGVDEIAHQIRRSASENGVPIHRDPPTARALYATVDIGAEIQPDMYRPVAAAIRFADSIRRKAKERGF